MPLLKALSCRPSVPPEPSAACMPWLILLLSPTGDCCRERQNSIFVLEYTSSHAWVLYSSYYQIKEVSCEIGDFIETHLCKLSVILRSCMKQKKDAVWSQYHSTLSCWGASWSKVIVFIWYRMYVREDCLFWFFIEIQISFFESVPGSRYSRYVLFRF